MPATIGGRGPNRAVSRPLAVAPAPIASDSGRIARPASNGDRPTSSSLGSSPYGRSIARAASCSPASADDGNDADAEPAQPEKVRTTSMTTPAAVATSSSETDSSAWWARLIESGPKTTMGIPWGAILAPSVP